MRLTEMQSILFGACLSDHGEYWPRTIQQQQSLQSLVRKGLVQRISDMDGTRYRLTDLGRAEREKLRSSK